jgi:hypothetical protein
VRHAELKAKQRRIRDSFPADLALRVHRSLSWLDRGEQSSEDLDAQFIFLWIGFNAAYAADIDASPQGERGRFGTFFKQLVSLDINSSIYDAVWNNYTSEVKLIANNRYVFSPFWSYQNGDPTYKDWEKRLLTSKVFFERAIKKEATADILSVLFDRLYVLRNQLIHGGATWNSKINRDQLKDATSILLTLLPIFIDLMMGNPEVVWGAPYYPVVD